MTAKISLLVTAALAASAGTPLAACAEALQGRFLALQDEVRMLTLACEAGQQDVGYRGELIARQLDTFAASLGDAERLVYQAALDDAFEAIRACRHLGEPS